MIFIIDDGLTDRWSNYISAKLNAGSAALQGLFKISFLKASLLQDVMMPRRTDVRERPALWQQAVILSARAAPERAGSSSAD